MSISTLNRNSKVLSSLFDPGGTIITHTATRFEMRDAAGNLTRFQGTGFTFDPGSHAPTGGTITSVKFFEPGRAQPVGTVTNLTGDTDLLDFWNNAQTQGSKTAFDGLFLRTDQTGSNGIDLFETYGNLSILNGRDGADIFHVGHAVTVNGGAGNDSIILKGNVFVDVDGGAGQDEIVIDTLSNGFIYENQVTKVEVFRLAGPGKFLTLSLNNFDPQNVQFIANEGPDRFTIVLPTGHDPNDPINANGRLIDCRNFTDEDILTWDFADLNAPFNIVGAPDARNAFLGNDFKNKCWGGKQDDLCKLGGGDDWFDGGKGIDGAGIRFAFGDGSVRFIPTKIRDTAFRYMTKITDDSVIDPSAAVVDRDVDTYFNVEVFLFTDITEFLPVITSNGGGTLAAIDLAENKAVVTNVNATDQNTDQELTFKIFGGPDGDDFRINAGTGVLRFKNAPDFENPTDADGDNTYRVIVEVFDGLMSSLQLVNVGVTDVVE